MLRDGSCPARSKEMYEGPAKSPTGRARNRFACPILQKCDNSAVAVFYPVERLTYMKTKYRGIDWLILLLGMGVVAGGFAAATTYLGLERKIHSGEVCAVILDRLYQDQKLSAALKTLHDGDAATAAQRLDLLLCDNILRIHSELASADDRTRAYVKDEFARIARLRPRNSDIPVGAKPERSDDQAEAEKILAQACIETARAN